GASSCSRVIPGSDSPRPWARSCARPRRPPDLAAMDADRTPSWRRYLRFWGSNPREDVSQEIEFHLQGLIEQYVAQGMSEAEAHTVALRRFGDPQRIAGAMRALAEQ